MKKYGFILQISLLVAKKEAIAITITLQEEDIKWLSA